MGEPQDTGLDVIRQSKRLIGASRQLVESAQATIETSKELLDQARNAVQVTWFWRVTLKRRLRQQ